MKKLAIVLLMVVCLSCVFCACDVVTQPTYTITSAQSNYTVTVGQEIDLKSYFSIVNERGEGIVVTDAMIDAPEADLTKEGAFIVTCSYQGASKSIIIIVEKASQGDDQTHSCQSACATCNGCTDATCTQTACATKCECNQHSHNFSQATCTEPATCACGQTSGDALGHTQPNADGKCDRCGTTLDSGNQGTTPADLSEIFALYTDYESWNFELAFDVDADDADVAEATAYTCIYFYDGYNFYYTDALGSFVDYVVYTDDDILYYYNNEDGSYTKLSYNDNYDEFYELYAYLDWVDLALLGDYDWVQSGNHYAATNANDAGNALIGEYEDCTYTAVDLYVENGKITKIVATQQDDYYNAVFTYTVEISNYNTITVDVSNLNVDNGSTGGNTGDNTGGNTGGDVTPPSGDNVTTSKTIDLASADSKVSATSEKLAFADGNLKVTVDKASATSPLVDYAQQGKATRVYYGATLTVEYPQMTKLVINCETESTGFDGMSVSGATITRDGTTITITFATPTDKFVSLPVTKQVRVLSIEVFATGSGNDTGSSTPSKDVMPEQAYDETKHQDYDNILYDAITDYDTKNDYLPSTGLPSQGSYNVLVVPVEFSNDKFTAQELTDLNNVFNNKASTGWESVSSYYQTSSYGKLNLTFDVVDKITLNSKYSSFDGGQDYGGDILRLALDQLYARGIDLSRYDYDNNGVVDGVYIIYSAPIDYVGDYYWAYVTQYPEDLSYGNLEVYNYLFASVDFMYEDIETSDPDEFSPVAGLKLNATTYIHETGHMLGLDDYYDYNPKQGSDQGLGGADMMDYTVGDHNAYSKLLLGWVKPTAVVTNTQTITISNLESSGQFIIVLLDYDGTYFSEYLIIDLYSATGLNALHAGVEDSYLYEGASFGARIYHIDATIANPYGDDYYSFTDNNNSMTRDPLIKLVEADGDTNYESDQAQDSYGDYYGYAANDDLWQTGDVFSEIQPNYTRNDGKLVNFDISFDSVTANSLTVTITFDSAE